MSGIVVNKATIDYINQHAFKISETIRENKIDYENILKLLADLKEKEDGKYKEFNHIKYGLKKLNPENYEKYFGKDEKKSSGICVSNFQKLLIHNAKIELEVGVKELTGRNDHPRIDYYHDVKSHPWLKNQPWCASFVSRMVAKTAEEMVIENPFPHHYAGVKDMANMAVKKGWFEHTAGCCPMCGDIFVINTDTPKTSDDHTGFVLSYDQNRGMITTIEGNSSNKLLSRDLSLENISGIIRIKIE